MSRNFSTILRQQVSSRANNCCEYCLLSEEDSFLPFQIDHIIALKHGGGDLLENLAYACPHCNQHKGSDLSTYLERKGTIIPLFHPRNHSWNEHFVIESGAIYGRTETGEGTAKLLQFNQAERIMIRRLLAEAGRYPLS